MAVRVIVSMPMTVPVPVIVGVAFYGGLGRRMAVIMSVLMIMVVVIVVIVMLAHASFPLAGSAICSSISFRTSLICASAAE